MTQTLSKKRKRTVELPVPVKIDSRNCFGISYFASEADARAFAASVRARAETYNGGFYHGMQCGRDTGFDYTDATLGPIFAVTTR
jgi:hypothetical protein